MSFKKRLLTTVASGMLVFGSSTAHALPASEADPQAQAETQLVESAECTSTATPETNVADNATAGEPVASFSPEPTAEPAEPIVDPAAEPTSLHHINDSFVFDTYGVNGPFQRNTDDNNVHFGEAGIGLLIMGFLTTPMTFPLDWTEECTHILPDNT